MEETNEAEGMRAEREAGGSDELQSRIQELEGELEDVKHDYMALRNHLARDYEEDIFHKMEVCTLIVCCHGKVEKMKGLNCDISCI